MPTGHDDSGPPSRWPERGSVVITVNEPQRQCYVRWPNGTKRTYFLRDGQTECGIVDSIRDHLNTLMVFRGV